MKPSESFDYASRDSLFSRTYLDSLVPLEDGTLPPYSTRWQNQGRWTSRGESWTRSGSEFHKDAAVSSLSQILEESVPEKYYLSPKACTGILRRAERRGKELPEALERALGAAQLRRLPDQPTPNQGPAHPLPSLTLGGISRGGGGQRGVCCRYPVGAGGAGKRGWADDTDLTHLSFPQWSLAVTLC